MEIKITTTQILKVLQVLSWIIFIGLCIEAGGIAVNTAITLFIHPHGAKNFWEGSDYLSKLYAFDHGYFLVITLIMTVVAVLKAMLFYLIVRLFADKKLNISQPFSRCLRKFILNLSYFSLGVGFMAHLGYKYALWLSQHGLEKADLQALRLGGADVWIFLAVILLVIAQLVKRGIEIQNENDLTI
ncbi:MAG: DUF2975 domain-containing protein [Cyclobacteriaceae bacterium]|nr:DUF2975 domain-containing protein [Cyclobacteriaceae bacterium]